MGLGQGCGRGSNAPPTSPYLLLKVIMQQRSTLPNFVL